MTTVFQTRSNLYFDYLEPKPHQVSLSDIAQSLGRIPRFNGHTNTDHWTVADHLLWMHDSTNASHLFLIHILLSDAHEAYLTDAPRPLKDALTVLAGKDLFGILSARADAAIYTALGLPLPDQTQTFLLKTIDDKALAYEQFTFMTGWPTPSPEHALLAPKPLIPRQNPGIDWLTTLNMRLEMWRDAD